MIDLTTIEQGGASIALSIIGLAFPEAAPIIAIVKEAIPAIAAAAPYIKAAVSDGKSAFEAAIAAAPELEAHIEALARKIPMAAGVIDWKEHLDSVTAAAVSDLYKQNLADSGYDPKNDFDQYGNMKVNP